MDLHLVEEHVAVLGDLDVAGPGHEHLHGAFWVHAVWLLRDTSAQLRNNYKVTIHIVQNLILKHNFQINVNGVREGLEQAK